MKSCVAAIDQGTTSTRVIVFNHAGEIRSIAQREHEQIYPRPGWVEHDPEEIWRRTCEVMQEACQRGGLAAKDLSAIGITNQRETTILWDRRTGAPVMNAIVWQDTRVDSLVSRFSANGGSDRFRILTGLPLSTYFSGLKILWMLEHVAGIRKRAESGEV